MIFHKLQDACRKLPPGSIVHVLRQMMAVKHITGLFKIINFLQLIFIPEIFVKCLSGDARFVQNILYSDFREGSLLKQAECGLYDDFSCFH